MKQNVGKFSKNLYERIWCTIFLALYVFIIIPFPWFYNEQYIPGWLGVPIFLYAWIFYGILVVILTGIFAYVSLSRPEYSDKSLIFPTKKKKIKK